MEHERYLREKPDLRHMLKLFSRQLMLEKPDDVLAFAAAFFCQDDLQAIVEADIASIGVLQESKKKKNQRIRSRRHTMVT